MVAVLAVARDGNFKLVSSRVVATAQITTITAAVPRQDREMRHSKLLTTNCIIPVAIRSRTHLIQDDPCRFQIRAPTQPGNPGGLLIKRKRDL